MQQRLLAHVVDDDAGRVVSAAGVPDVFWQQVLEHLAEHFRVNGDFLFQRLGFVDGEIVAVKHVEDARAGFVFLVCSSLAKSVSGSRISVSTQL